jgi:hypothetical protein
MKTKEINIFEQVGGTAAVSSEDGSALFDNIDKLLGEKAKISLDFVNIKTLTSSFLNAAIGQLYSKHTSSFLKNHVEVRNLSPEDTELLKRVVERAKAYFKDRKGIEKQIKETLGDE